MTRIYFLILICSPLFIWAQEQDSATLISEIRIEAYKKPTSYLGSTKSVSVISENLLRLNTPERMLEAINQNAGSRMEERSPGSYRISVRGSSLRSPFGVRNVKVYLDDFILSDASGNTYFNIISPELINRIEIYKGSESGDFGSVTGGTLLLKTRNLENLSAQLFTGSYGTFNQSVDFSKKFGNHFFSGFPELLSNRFLSRTIRSQSETDFFERSFSIF